MAQSPVQSPVVQREDPQWARLLAMVTMGYLLLVLHTTVFAWWAVGPLQLRPLVVLVVSAGFHLPFWSGALCAAVLGYCLDLFSGGVLGLHMFAFLVVFVVCALARRKLEIGSAPFQILAAGAMSWLHQVLVAGGLILINRQPHFWLDLPLFLLMQAMLTALTAPVFFALLELVVRIFSLPFGKRTTQW